MATTSSTPPVAGGGSDGKNDNSNNTASTTSYHNAMLAGLVCTGNIHLVIGTNPLAASRCAQSLAAGATPILIAPATADLHYGLQAKVDDGSVRWEQKAFEDADLFRLGRDDVGRVVDAVFVTGGPRDALSEHISSLCRRNRVPVNVVDAPHLCTFTLLSVHADGPLQVGVTTNGRGCKLASRIRREVAAALPQGLGAACARLGEVRRRIQDADDDSSGNNSSLALGDLDDSLDQGARFNRLVAEEDVRNRRIRWLSQVCEYWPLRKLAAVADEDVDRLLAAYPGLGADSASTRKLLRRPGDDESAAPPPRVGRLILAGSGPGHPSLLTRATLDAIHRADLILADKLVPAPVLDLIPRRTPVHIARKFPGNAERAQEELLEAALRGVREGKAVLRLKQGDPFVYGRGGEEVDWFKARGLGDRVRVLPGVTSALSAPLFAGVPVTQRDVADQVLICTGTGKKGKPPTPPEYVASRTVVFLMALHRIVGLVRELTAHLSADADADHPDGTTPLSPDALAADAKRVLWPLSTPCAVIERASCPDQRIIRTTLAHVAEAIESEGSRPPGLLVVGRACDFLHPREKGRAWLVEEGFRGLDDEWADEQAEWAAGLDAVTAAAAAAPRDGETAGA